MLSVYALVMAVPGVVATAGYASCEPPARLILPGLAPGRNLVDDPAFAEAPWLRTCDNPENVDALRGVSQDAYKRGPRQQAAVDSDTEAEAEEEAAAAALQAAAAAVAAAPPP